MAEREATALAGALLALLSVPAYGQEFDLQDSRRFLSSGFVDGAFYIVLDRETGCKYLWYGSGQNAVMSPLIADDRLPDCSGPKEKPDDR